MPNPTFIYLNMDNPSEQLEKEMMDFSSSNTMDHTEEVEEHVSEGVFSEEETRRSRELTGAELGMQYDKAVVFSHLPNEENRVKYTRLLPLIPEDVTTFMIVDKHTAHAPLSTEDLIATLGLIPQHVTKHACLRVDLSPYLPTHVTTLIIYPFVAGKPEGKKIPSFPGMRCLEIRFNLSDRPNRENRLSEEDIKVFLQPTLSELRIVAVKESRSERTKLGYRFKSALNLVDWDVLNKADNLHSLHFGTRCFTLPDRDFSIHSLLKQVRRLPNRLKKLSFYWDDVYHYTPEELQQLGDELIKKQIENIELLHSTTGTDRVMDVKTKTILEKKYERYLDKLDALTRWKSQDALIKNTLSTEPHNFPLAVTDIISGYMGITLFNPAMATRTLTTEAPCSNPNPSNVSPSASTEPHNFPLAVTDIISGYMGITLFNPTTATRTLTTEAPCSNPNPSNVSPSAP